MMGLWSFMRIHTVWITSTAHTEINTHKHTTHNPQAHTAPPKLKRGDEPALQDNPAAHMRFTHMLGGLVNIPLMGEKTQDTGRGEKWVRDNTTGVEKKRWSFFHSKTDECRCQQSHAVDKKQRGREWWKTGNKEKKKWRQVEWHKTNRVAMLSNGCEMHYCLWCTALFLICLWIQ